MAGIARTVLGLDLGVGSVGWALISEERVGDSWAPVRIKDLGVRVFEKGMEEDRAGIKRSSPAAARRGFRSTRRRIWRRATRKRGVLSMLQSLGLVPPELPVPSKPGESPIGLWCQAFDHAWWKQQGGGHRAAQVIPYALRAEALRRKLSEEELGRALLHLAQRRGYQSNRIGGGKEDEKELGPVKKGISELTGAMEQAGAPTLGVYLSALDPDQIRIRERWTSRAMFRDELNKIFMAQAAHHPVLTDEVKAKLRKLFFFQRPIWWPKSSIGRCELEPRSFRAPMALLECQRFRLLQRVNDLKIEGDGSRPDGVLNPEERRTILFALEQKEHLSASQARKLIGLTGRGVKFNFEREEDPRPFKGNVTASRIREAVGAQWDHWVAEVVVCDAKHQPTGLLVPLVGNAIQTERIRAQASVSEPRRKQLWKQIVQAKLRNQAGLLDVRGGSDHGLRAMAMQVTSGDTTNREAQGARRYWTALFGPGFRRDRDAEDANRFLNYGYALLRSLAARALVGAGLHPSLGVQHHNRYDPLALASDLMEPYRPWVDARVAKLVDDGASDLNKSSKSVLFELFQDPVVLAEERWPLQDALHRSAARLAQAYTQGRARLLLPAW